MNILFLTQILPYPLNSGGKIHTYFILKRLSKRNNLYLVSFIFKDDKTHIFSLKRALKLKKIVTISHKYGKGNNWTQERKFMLKSLLSLYPYGILKFEDKRIYNKISEILSKNAIDYIWIDHLSMHQYLPKNLQIKKILSTQNTETLLYFLHARFSEKLKWKFFFLIEAVKYFFYESEALSAYSKIYSVSYRDRLHLQQIYSIRNLFHSKKKLSKFSILKPQIERKFQTIERQYEDYTLLFIGSLFWYPNCQGIRWFLMKVFPLVLKEIPSCELVVVGEAPDHLLKENYKNVTFTGHVKILFPYYKKANVFIVPLFIGSGIRIKILEALSYSIPIVSTSTGSEGISEALGKKIRIANSPEEFKNEILKILSVKK